MHTDLAERGSDDDGGRSIKPQTAQTGTKCRGCHGTPARLNKVEVIIDDV